ncbi:MAG: DUF4422 domain-containing protein [Ruminococcaceae bacterium]|nr:DUF4422 domain-containing protein [Oscillospiraceae bacterium]
MAVYVATHKAFDPPALPAYVPLQVGAALHPALPYTPDNTGDHISGKNPHYCELTGLYWVWKNTHDPYKGLVHYRRYFIHRGKPVTEAYIQHLLADHDILLPRMEYLREPAAKEFCLHSGRAQDLALVRQAVEAVDPAYLPAYDRVMAGGSLHLYNMLIAPREVYDRYCAWLFAVLTHMEPLMDMTGYTPYEQRLFGFVGERLLNVWVAHTAPRVVTLPVVNTELTLAGRLRLFLRRYKNRLLFVNE